MRIPHKYLRNRHFRLKHWKRVRTKSHPFKTYTPGYWVGDRWVDTDSFEEQIKRHFEWIEKQARNIESGTRIVQCPKSAPKWFRKMLNSRRKAQERQALRQARNGNYDTEFPKFKPDAAWQYW